MTCCAKPAIVDLSQGFKAAQAEGRTNKMCKSCGVHWFGYGEEVKQYTRAEWDAWVNVTEESTCN